MSIYRFRVGIKDIGNIAGPFLGAFNMNHACLLLNEDIFEYGANSDKSYERHRNVGRDNSYDWEELSSLSGKTRVSPDSLETAIKNDGSWGPGHYWATNHNCHDFVRFCLDRIGCPSSMITKIFFCFTHHHLEVNIRSALGDKNLDVCQCQMKNETKIILYEAHGGKNQIFTKRKNKDGTYTFLIGGYYAIDVRWAQAENGTQIQLYESNGTNAQKFYIQDENDGYFSIHSAINSNYVIDVDTGDNEKIQLWEYHGGKNQKFKFI